jgi:hypothetical protein
MANLVCEQVLKRKIRVVVGCGKFKKKKKELIKIIIVDNQP